MSEFHFLRPVFLLAFIPVILLGWRLLRTASQSASWSHVCDPHLLKHLLSQQVSHKKNLPLMLLIAVWLMTTFALAGPTWNKQPQPVYKNTDAKVIVLDLSNDMYGTDLKPNRLTRAKFKVQDILRKIQEGQVGMIAFSSEPFVVSPLTDDAATISAMIPVLDPSIMPVQGSNTAAALKKAGELLQQSGNTSGEILLITSSPANADAYSVAKKLRSKGFTTSALQLGPDHSDLKSLAQAGGGKYITFTDTEYDINSLLSAPSHHLSSHLHQSTQTASAWKDSGPWFVLFLIPLFAIGFRRGWLE